MQVDVVSVFMANLPHAIAAAQDAVVRNFLPDRTASWRQLLTTTRHGEALDALLQGGVCLESNNVLIVLDADAIPLSPRALSHMVERARAGVLIGNIQRSNHIANGRHVYAAPSAMAFTRQTFERLGAPSFVETSRGDVGEELTYAAEDRGIAVELLQPLQVFGEKRWALGGDDSPRYGNACVFGTPDEALFFHQFEIRNPQQQAPFVSACQAVVAGETLDAAALCRAHKWPAPPLYAPSGSYRATLQTAVDDGVVEALLAPPAQTWHADAERWARLTMRMPSLFGLVRILADTPFGWLHQRLRPAPALRAVDYKRVETAGVLLQREALKKILARAAPRALDALDTRAFHAEASRIVGADSAFSGPLDCLWSAL